MNKNQLINLIIKGENSTDILENAKKANTEYYFNIILKYCNLKSGQVFINKTKLIKFEELTPAWTTTNFNNFVDSLTVIIKKSEKKITKDILKEFITTWIDWINIRCDMIEFESSSSLSSSISFNLVHTLPLNQILDGRYRFRNLISQDQGKDFDLIVSNITLFNNITKDLIKTFK